MDDISTTVVDATLEVPNAAQSVGGQSPSNSTANKPEREYSSDTVASTIDATDEDTEEDDTKLAREESKDCVDGLDKEGGAPDASTSEQAPDSAVASVDVSAATAWADAVAATNESDEAPGATSAMSATVGTSILNDAVKDVTEREVETAEGSVTLSAPISVESAERTPESSDAPRNEEQETEGTVPAVESEASMAEAAVEVMTKVAEGVGDLIGDVTTVIEGSVVEPPALCVPEEAGCSDDVVAGAPEGQQSTDASAPAEAGEGERAIDVALAKEDESVAVSVEPETPALTDQSAGKGAPVEEQDVTPAVPAPGPSEAPVIGAGRYRNETRERETIPIPSASISRRTHEAGKMNVNLV